ncbi:MAG: hypothetical protein A3F72_21455 [Bacteroidetes bacterium RIFCSPLOWO2_12_FULL_35_15]|nr:MAG: hypothetical protein A3F72_21455 [Bacteroidetes bacterium RIFCSPLOWO2_12_FULL_35_15]
MRTKITLTILLSFMSFYIHAQHDSIQKLSTLTELSLEELMNIKVYTASKILQKTSDAPAIISVVTYQDIREMGVTSLIDVLKYIPGIETSMGPDGHYRVSIRGTRTDGDILLLINGLHMNNFYDGKSIFDLPVDFIDKIEIIRGPGSALFGSNAVAGVINVFTVKEKKVTAGIGTNGTFSGNINYYLEKDKIQWDISGGYTQNDGANAIIDEDGAKERPWSLTYGSDTYRTKRWNKDAYLSTNLFFSNLKFSLFNIYKEHGAWAGPQFIVAPGSKYQTNQMIANISYDFEINKNLTLTPRVYYSIANQDNLLNETPVNYVSLLSGDVFKNGKQIHEKYSARTYGGEIAIKIKVNDKCEILTGNIYEYQFLPMFDLIRNYKIVGDVYKEEFGNYDNIVLTQKEKNRTVTAYYIQGNYNWKKLNITAGLRYDDYSDFGQSFNPRLGITYNVSKRISFKGLYGKAFRAPTFQELYDNSSLGNMEGVKGNEKLQPGNIQTAELGTEFNYKKIILRYNIFYNFKNNLIRIYDPHGGGSIGVYENIGDLTKYGNEAEAILLITPKIKFFANYSQYISEFKWNEKIARKADLIYLEKQSSCDQQIKNSPTIKLNLGFNINVYKFSVFAGFNYGSQSENNKRFYLEENRFTRIPSYLQANFSIAYSLNKFKFRIAANNIGKKYSDPDESTNIRAFGSKGLIQPTETFLLTVSYKF